MTVDETIILVWQYNLRILEKVLATELAVQSAAVARALTFLDAKSDTELIADVFSYNVLHQESLTACRRENVERYTDAPDPREAPFDVPAVLNRASIYALWGAFYAWDYQYGIDKIIADIDKAELIIEAAKNEYWQESNNQKAKGESQ